MTSGGEYLKSAVGLVDMLHCVLGFVTVVTFGLELHDDKGTEILGFVMIGMSSLFITLFLMKFICGARCLKWITVLIYGGVGSILLLVSLIFLGFIRRACKNKAQNPPLLDAEIADCTLENRVLFILTFSTSILYIYSGVLTLIEKAPAVGTGGQVFPAGNVGGASMAGGLGNAGGSVGVAQGGGFAQQEEV